MIRFLAFAVALAASSWVHAAPTIVTGTGDHWETVNIGTSNSFSYDSGTTGSDRALVCAIIYEQLTAGDGVDSATPPTYNSVAMTKILEGDASTSGSGQEQTIEFWRLLAPATGSNTLLITWLQDNNADAAAICATFQDVNQSTPTGATQIGDGTSLTSGVDNTVTITTNNADSLIVTASTADEGGNTGLLGASTDDTLIEQQQLDEGQTGNGARGFTSVLVSQSAPTSGSYDTGFQPAVTTTEPYDIVAIELNGTASGSAIPTILRRRRD